MASRTRRAPPLAPPSPPAIESHPTAVAVLRLADEVRVLRDVLGEIREDLNWVTRNGLPLRPAEHVLVKRMAKNPLDPDWVERLEMAIYPIPGSFDSRPPGEYGLDRLARDLCGTVEATAENQLEIVLIALDGIRAELLAALKRPRESKEPGNTAATDPEPNPPSASNPKRQGTLF